VYKPFFGLDWCKTLVTHSDRRRLLNARNKHDGRLDRTLTTAAGLPRLSLQCFDAVDWVAGRASGLQRLSGEVSTGVVVCLERGANDLRMVQLMPRHLLLH